MWPNMLPVQNELHRFPDFLPWLFLLPLLPVATFHRVLPSLLSPGVALLHCSVVLLDLILPMLFLFFCLRRTPYLLIPGILVLPWSGHFLLHNIILFRNIFENLRAISLLI